MRKIVFIISGILLLGCTGPVTNLRNMSISTELKGQDEMVSHLLYKASKVSMYGKRELTMRFEEGQDLSKLKRKVKRIDRRFDVEIIDSGYCTMLKLSW
jgi:hypothetical protein